MNILKRLAVLMLVLGLFPGESQAKGLGALLSGLRTVGGKGITLLDKINTNVPRIDKTKDILEKWSDEWSKDLAEQNEAVQALTGELNKLKVPKDAKEREDFVHDLEALGELIKNEREALKKKRDEVRKDVDKCLADKKAIFECEDIFTAIDLASYRNSLMELDSAVQSKLKDAKKAPKS